MEATTKNIFNIPDPDEWLCEVKDYMSSHSQLFFRLHRATPDQNLYLAFQAVEYFEGPLLWKGADFRLGDPDACLRLLRITDRHKRSKDASLIEMYRLYVVALPNVPSFQPKIVAARRDILTEPDFRQAMEFCASQ